MKELELGQEKQRGDCGCSSIVDGSGGEGGDGCDSCDVGDCRLDRCGDARMGGGQRLRRQQNVYGGITADMEMLPLSK
jgi:hypothetical protein